MKIIKEYGRVMENDVDSPEHLDTLMEDFISYLGTKLVQSAASPSAKSGQGAASASRGDGRSPVRGGEDSYNLDSSRDGEAAESEREGYLTNSEISSEIDKHRASFFDWQTRKKTRSKRRDAASESQAYAEKQVAKEARIKMGKYSSDRSNQPRSTLPLPTLPLPLDGQSLDDSFIRGNIDLGSVIRGKEKEEDKIPSWFAAYMTHFKDVLTMEITNSVERMINIKCVERMAELRLKNGMKESRPRGPASPSWLSEMMLAPAEVPGASPNPVFAEHDDIVSPSELRKRQRKKLDMNKRKKEAIRLLSRDSGSESDLGYRGVMRSQELGHRGASRAQDNQFTRLVMRPVEMNPLDKRSKAVQLALKLKRKELHQRNSTPESLPGDDSGAERPVAGATAPDIPKISGEEEDGLFGQQLGRSQTPKPGRSQREMRSVGFRSISPDSNPACTIGKPEAAAAETLPNARSPIAKCRRLPRRMAARLPCNDCEFMCRRPPRNLSSDSHSADFVGAFAKPGDSNKKQRRRPPRRVRLEQMMKEKNWREKSGCLSLLTSTAGISNNGMHGEPRRQQETGDTLGSGDIKNRKSNASIRTFSRQYVRQRSNLSARSCTRSPSRQRSPIKKGDPPVERVDPPAERVEPPAERVDPPAERVDPPAADESNQADNHQPGMGEPEPTQSNEIPSSDEPNADPELTTSKMRQQPGAMPLALVPLSTWKANRLEIKMNVLRFFSYRTRIDKCFRRNTCTAQFFQNDDTRPAVFCEPKRRGNNVIPAGSVYTSIMSLINMGQSWEDPSLEYTLRLVSDKTSPAAASLPDIFVPLPGLQSGGTGTVQMDFMTPSKEGPAESVWRFHAGSEPFGPIVRFQVYVMGVPDFNGATAFNSIDDVLHAEEEEESESREDQDFADNITVTASLAPKISFIHEDEEETDKDASNSPRDRPLIQVISSTENVDQSSNSGDSDAETSKAADSRPDRGNQADDDGGYMTLDTTGQNTPMVDDYCMLEHEKRERDLLWQCIQESHSPPRLRRQAALAVEQKEQAKPEKSPEKPEKSPDKPANPKERTEDVAKSPQAQPVVPVAEPSSVATATELGSDDAIELAVDALAEAMEDLPKSSMPVATSASRRTRTRMQSKGTPSSGASSASVPCDIEIPLTEDDDDNLVLHKGVHSDCEKGDCRQCFEEDDIEVIPEEGFEVVDVNRAKADKFVYLEPREKAEEDWQHVETSEDSSS